MNQQLEPNSGPEVKSPTTSKFSLFLVGGLLFVVIFVAGYKLLSNSSTPPPQSPQIPQTSPTPLPKYEIEKISENTNKYIDFVYNFTFEFPSNMIIDSRDKNNIYITNPPKDKSATHPEGESSTITLREKQINETLDSIIESIQNPSDSYEREFLKNKIKINQKEIGSLQGYEITGLPGYYPAREFYTIQNDIVFHISAGPIEGYSQEIINKAESLYNQILSTFQFLN